MQQELVEEMVPVQLEYGVVWFQAVEVFNVGHIFIIKVLSLYFH